MKPYIEGEIVCEGKMYLWGIQKITRISFTQIRKILN